MNLYAIRNKETNKLIDPRFYKNKTPKFYPEVKFAKCAMTFHGLSLDDYEIVEFELTNEKVVS